MLSTIRALGTAFSGKTAVPPFISQRYRGFSERESQQKKVFPYDVPYYNKGTVHDLVELSKQYYFSDLTLLRLKNDPTFPKSLLARLEPLKGIRFFQDELVFELKNRLGPVDYAEHAEYIMIQCGNFSKLKEPLWTWERARAHLQTSDVLLRRASASDYLWNIWKSYEKAGKRLTETQLRGYLESHSLGQNLQPPMWMQYRSRQIGETAETLWYKELERQGQSVPYLRQQHFKMQKDVARELQRVSS